MARKSTILLPATQARAALGISDHVLREAIRRGEIAAVRINGRIYVPAAAIEELTARAFAQTTPQAKPDVAQF